MVSGVRKQTVGVLGLSYCPCLFSPGSRPIEWHYLKFQVTLPILVNPMKIFLHRHGQDSSLR